MSAAVTRQHTITAARGEVRPWLVLVTVSLGAMLAPLNSTMVAVALPDIRHAFGISHAAVGWFASSYLIAMAATQPLAGRLGDAIGRKQVFRAGLSAFLVCSVAAAVAPSYPLLLVFRTLQAVSGAVLIPNGVAMLRGAAPPGAFGKYNGWYSAIIGSTAAVGPVLGGFVLAAGSWRWLFLANVPVILAALLLSSRTLGGQDDRRGRARIDGVGVALFAGSLLCLTLLLSASGSADWRRAVLVAPVLAVCLAVFAWWQRRSASPAADWRLFRLRSFTGASTHILLTNLAMYTVLLAIPFFLTEVQHRSSALAGAVLATMAALQALSAPIAGSLSDRLGRRTPALVSSSLGFLAALALVAGIGRDVSPVFLGVVVAALGLAVGIGFVASSAAAVEAVPTEASGAAAGTQSMMRYLGSIIGVGLLSGLLSKDGSAPDVAVFRELFGIVAIMLAVSVVPARLISGRRQN